jgi:hypothetical protein
MRAITAVLLLFVINITCNAQKLDGSWKGKMTGPNGEMNLLFTFTVNGDSLKGSVTSDMGTLPLVNGKVKGNDFSFDINVNDMVISDKGVLQGDIVKLTGAGMEEPMVLNRVKNDAKSDVKSDAKSDAKIEGKWLGKVSSPQGEFEMTFTFKVDGNKLTGKSSSAMGDTDLSNGVVNGNEFSFDIDMQGMKITHKGKYLDDGTIDLKVNVNDQDMAMKLTRAN